VRGEQMVKKISIEYTEGEGLERIDFSGDVTLKKLNFSEKNALEEESTDIKFFGNTPQVKVSTSKMKELGLLKSIVECTLVKTTYVQDKVTKNIVPVTNDYNLDITGIRNLPTDIGEELVYEFTEMNNVSPKKKD
jgi:hypothetical protein